MSWLADIAGKAENLLNQIDQNAAVALSNVNEQSKGKYSPKRNKASSQDFTETVTKPEFLPNQQERESVPSIRQNISKFSTTYESQGELLDRKKQRDKNRPRSKETIRKTKDLSPKRPTVKSATDEELLQFLNSSSPAPALKELDEASLLKKELMDQVGEMGLLVKNYKKLQQDHETLKQLYDGIKRELSPNLIGLNEVDHIGSSERIKHLESILEEKNEEVQRLSERLDDALGKLQSIENVQVMQNRLEQVELEKKRLVDSNQETMEKCNQLIHQVEAMSKQAQSARDSLLASEAEYATYKNKAKSILKSKDELITLLEKHQNRDSQLSSNTNSEDNHYYAEINTLRNERELFQAEITQSLSQIEALKEESNRLENELLSLRSINSDLQNILTKERQRVRIAQEENLQLSQAISTLRLDLEREKIDKKKMLEKHCRTASNPMTRSSSSSDFLQFQSNSTRHSPIQFHDSSDESNQLRTRITALSQSLLEKQSLINELSSDKQLLQINIERLEAHFQELSLSTKFVNDNICTQSVVSSQPLYLTESPWDSSMALGVKRIYSQVDALCCQFGVAMRQRPNLRLGFSIYVLALHIWVFFVLFSWSHSASPSDLREK